MKMLQEIGAADPLKLMVVDVILAEPRSRNSHPDNRHSVTPLSLTACHRRSDNVQAEGIISVAL